MYLLTEETMLMVGQRSAIKEVNDWAHNTLFPKHMRQLPQLYG